MIALKDFNRPVPQKFLNIEAKRRSNLFAWRGQFSPQLVECLLNAYCLPGSVVLDPFVGSGTVLFEAAVMAFSAYGFEINPSAWSFSKVYEFINVPSETRKLIIKELQARIEDEFPVVIFADQSLSRDAVEERIIRVGASISEQAKIMRTTA